MCANNNYPFSEFMTGFLPELEAATAAYGPMRSKLDELEQFYSNQTIPEIAFARPAGRKALVAIDGVGDWAADVKVCALFADAVICEDPLLHALDESTTFWRENVREFGRSNMEAADISRFAHVISKVREVMPLIQAGILMFYPLRRPVLLGIDESVRSTLKPEMEQYLVEEGEIRDGFQFNNQCAVKVYVPMIDDVVQTSFSMNYIYDYGMSYQQAAANKLSSVLEFNYFSTVCGMRAADLASGSFWTSRDWYWHLCRQATENLAPHAKIYSFINTFSRPAIETVAAKDVVSLRSQEDAFHRFRQQMLNAGSAINSDPDNPNFENEIQDVFTDMFEPSFSAIKSAMRRNIILQNAPWLTASTGFAYAASSVSNSPIASTALGTLSAAFGFGSLFNELVGQPKRIRSEPAYILWKLNKMSGDH